jgi:hypothetical protein
MKKTTRLTRISTGIIEIRRLRIYLPIEKREIRKQVNR